MRPGARRVALLGLLGALALALAFAESLLPPLLFLPVGVRLGLSNIVTMYGVLFLGPGAALSIAGMKSLFVLLTRGPVGAAMSLSGGMCSVGVMLLLRRSGVTSKRILSISGALSHNVGQLAAAGLLLRTWMTLYYLPVMLLSGAAMGWLTAALLQAALPYLQHADQKLRRGANEGEKNVI